MERAPAHLVSRPAIVERAQERPLNMMPNYLSELPQFLSLLAMGVLLLGVFFSLYTFLTPHSELTLIFEGNTAAATMLAGAMIGFSLPVGASLANSSSVMALAQWGFAALVVQLAAYALLRLIHRGLHAAIEQNRVSVALWAATMSIALGILNAGAQLAMQYR